jgi:hypothetical protein
MLTFYLILLMLQKVKFQTIMFLLFALTNDILIFTNLKISN